MAAEPAGAIKIFYCYARKDKAGRDRLENHLEPLRRSGQIITWQDREILPGMKWKDEIDTRLNTSEVVLLLVSPAFMHSDYCYTVEMRRALERHKVGEAHVIPIILRPVAWKETPIGELQVLPSRGKAITTWRNRDEAFEDVATGIHAVVKTLLAGKTKEEQTRTTETAVPPSQSSQPPNIVAPSSQSLQLTVVTLLRTMMAVGKRTKRKLTRLLSRSPLMRMIILKRATAQSTIGAASFQPPLISPLLTQEPLSRGELQPPKRRNSRRAVVGGLIGLVATGGGMTWLLRSQRPQVSSPPSRPTAISTSNVTFPRGTTLYTYRAHSQGVYAVAWSPNGKYIASGGVDRTIQVWDATTGDNILTYKGHSSTVLAVAWSPDSKRIASGAGTIEPTMQVWDAITGNNVIVYRGHSDSVYAVAWSPDGKRIASGSRDTTVHIWNVSTADHVFIYRGHSDAVETVMWSPDGKRIASGGYDSTVQVWDATTGDSILTYKGHSDAVRSVGWSPDGKLIVSGSSDRTIQVWDAVSGKTLHVYHSRANVAVLDVAWSPSGKRIASGDCDNPGLGGGGDVVQLWSIATEENVYTYSGHSGCVTALAWSPNGKLIASGSYPDAIVQVWQAV